MCCLNLQISTKTKKVGLREMVNGRIIHYLVGRLHFAELLIWARPTMLTITFLKYGHVLCQLTVDSDSSSCDLHIILCYNIF